MASRGEQLNSNDFLTCSICLEQHVSPKCLPCLHSYCEKCISEYIVTIERQAGQTISEFPCPVCRTVVKPLNPQEDSSKWGAAFPNKSIMTNDEQLKTDPQECNVCKRKQETTLASNWCRECQEALCENCTKYHGLMKQLINHHVIKLKPESHFTTSELEQVCETCSIHNLKNFDAYCFDHKQLCCTICLTRDHRKCEDVRAIGELVGDEDDTFENILSGVHQATKVLIEDRKNERKRFDESFKEIESTTQTAVKLIKDKLDVLIISFIKELHLKQDECMTDDQDIKDSEMFLGVVEKAFETINKIRNYGTPVQLFMHIDRLRDEFDNSLDVLTKTLKQSKRLEAKFTMDDSLERLHVLEKMGKVEIEQSESKSVKAFENVVGTFLKRTILFETVKVRSNKTIHFNEFEVRTGLCIDEKTIIVCAVAPSEIKAIDISSGNEISKTFVASSPKRISFSTDNKMLYFTAQDGRLIRIQMDGEFKKPVSIEHRPRGPYTGGICVHTGFVYIIVGNTIQRIKDGADGKFQHCFTVDSSCQGCVNGLVSYKNHQLIYTSKDFTVECVSLYGERVFSYKDDEMKKVTSLAVSSSGVIFAGDEDGCVHIIDGEGKRRKTLIAKCEQIKQVFDVWLDKNEKRLFVCRGQFVEIYNIEI